MGENIFCVCIYLIFSLQLILIQLNSDPSSVKHPVYSENSPPTAKLHILAATKNIWHTPKYFILISQYLSSRSQTGRFHAYWEAVVVGQSRPRCSQHHHYHEEQQQHQQQRPHHIKGLLMKSRLGDQHLFYGFPSTTFRPPLPRHAGVAFGSVNVHHIRPIPTRLAVVRLFGHGGCLVQH